MEDFYWKRHPDGPFATLIAVATGHFHPEWPCAAMRRRLPQASWTVRGRYRMIRETAGEQQWR